MSGSTPASVTVPARDPLDVLADERRRAILRALGERPRSVGELAGELPVSRPAVSRHLRLLREAGLVTHEPDGTRNVYRLAPDGPAAVRARLEGIWGEGRLRFTLLAENTTRERTP